MGYVDIAKIKSEIKAIQKMIENQKEGKTDVSKEVFNAHMSVCIESIEKEVKKFDENAIRIN